MRRKTAARLVTALAAVGLLVSVTAARSGLATGPPDRGAGPTPAALAPAEEAAARELDPGVDRSPGQRREVARSDATKLREATTPRQTPKPVRARIGSVGINAAVRPVGVQADGQMQLPADPRVLGWYRYGMAPASGRGATVLAGHLDAEGFGIGPLVGLRDVQVEDTVVVTVADGRTQQYVVEKVRRFDRQGLPQSLFSRTGLERLHLITCGGAYDPDNGGYQKNLVVTAVLVG